MGEDETEGETGGDRNRRNGIFLMRAVISCINWSLYISRVG